MTKTDPYPLKITSGKYEVISSGVVHLTEPELKFELANLVIIYKFISNSEGSRYSAEVVDGELVISLFNFKNSLGEGKLEPLEIGTLSDRRLFATFFVTTPKNNLREFNYTFMLMEK